MAQFSGFFTNYANVSRSKNGTSTTDLMSNAVIVPSLNTTTLKHTYDGFIYLSNLLIQFSATTDASSVLSTTNYTLHFPISSKPYAVYGSGIFLSSAAPIICVTNQSITNVSCDIRVGNQGGQLFWYSIGPVPTTPIYTNIVNSGSILYINSVAISSSGQYQYICAGNGGTSYVYKNSTYGYGVWTSVYSVTSSFLYSISTDISGNYVTVVDQNGKIYQSNNSGTNWSNALSNSLFSGRSVTMNSTGQYQYAVSSYYNIDTFIGAIYKSSNYGSSSSFSLVYSTTLSFQSITCDSTGQYVYAVASNGGIYKSSNYGNSNSWSQTTATTTLAWKSITCDSTGQYVYAVVSNGGIYKSSNYGGSWSQILVTSADWYSIASDSTGKNLVAVQNGGGIYYSNNSGSTWSQTSTPSDNYRSVAMNYNGNIATATTYLTSAGNPIYVSLNASN